MTDRGSCAKINLRSQERSGSDIQTAFVRVGFVRISDARGDGPKTVRFFPASTQQRHVFTQRGPRQGYALGIGLRFPSVV